MISRCQCGLLLLIALAFDSRAGAPEELIAAMDAAVGRTNMIAVQVFIGQGDREVFFATRGARHPDHSVPTDRKTMFCIGSTSKPLAAVTLLRLVEQGRLGLDQPIDNWLPKIGMRKPTEGTNDSRAPTLSELLCHRAGVFSQKEQISREQAALLYQFDHSLREAVEGIAKYPLIAEPGARFAYSGAGYCVAGRVAEVAIGQPFDLLLQRELCRPLGMKRTTYFPLRLDANVATGAVWKDGKPMADPRQPHQTKPLQMQLVGGSLYSTVDDLAAFARMIVKDRVRFLKEASWREILRRRGLEHDYGLGWQLKRSSDRVVALFHSGHLASSLAHLRVNLERKTYLILLGAAVDRPGERRNPAWRTLNEAAMKVFSELPR